MHRLYQSRRAVGAPLFRLCLACLLTLLTGLSAPLQSPPTVLAGEDACENDPIISIDGAIVQIVETLPVRALRFLSPTAPIDIKVYIPENTRDARVLRTTGPAPERVTFIRSGERASRHEHARIRVEITAPDPPGVLDDYVVLFHIRSFDDGRVLDTDRGMFHAGGQGRGRVRIPWHDNR